MPHAPAYKRWLIPAAVGLMAVLAAIPSRWMRWGNVLGERALILIGPVSQPVIAMMGWASPAMAAKPEVVAKLENERDRWERLYRDMQRENETLRQQFLQFSKSALPPELGVQTVMRRVIGSSPEPGESLTVRVWKKDGVERNTVATTEGVQLVGRVIAAADLTCTVRLVTGMSAGPVECVITSPDKPDGPKCRLSPIAGGRLQGRARVESHQTMPEVGHVARLDDRTWPRSAQMLVVGAVTERKPLEAAGWYLITVEPTVGIERLSEVMLRIPAPELEDKGPAPSTDGGKP